MVGAIAVIPARGGSKRIPKKNIINFSGRPMIEWTIDAALQSGCFDRVVVSTDNLEIANIAKSAGAEVPFLREQYVDDVSNVSQVTCYALLQAQKYFDEEYQVVSQLMPNCPLRTKDTIVNSFNHFMENDVNFQLSCFKFGWQNPWWAFTKNEQGEPSALFHDARLRRSQDLPSLYCPTGAIWLAKTNLLLKSQNFYGMDHRFFEIPWKEAVDIDEYADLDFAMSLLKTR